MTVAELIQLLSSMPPEAECLVWADENELTRLDPPTGAEVQQFTHWGRFRLTKGDDLPQVPAVIFE